MAERLTVKVGFLNRTDEYGEQPEEGAKSPDLEPICQHHVRVSF